MDGPVHAKDDRRARHAARERGRVADVYPPEPARAHRVQEHARDRRRARLGADLPRHLRVRDYGRLAEVRVRVRVRLG